MTVNQLLLVLSNNKYIYVHITLYTTIPSSIYLFLYTIKYLADNKSIYNLYRTYSFM